MNVYPFNAPIREQMKFLQRNMDALANIELRLPHLRPWNVHVGTASISFASTDWQQVRDTFGPDDWSHEKPGEIRKQVDGVEICLALPQQTPRRDRKPWENFEEPSETETAAAGLQP